MDSPIMAALKDTCNEIKLANHVFTAKYTTLVEDVEQVFPLELLPIRLHVCRTLELAIYDLAEAFSTFTILHEATMQRSILAVKDWQTIMADHPEMLNPVRYITVVLTPKATSMMRDIMNKARQSALDLASQQHSDAVSRTLLTLLDNNNKRRAPSNWGQTGPSQRPKSNVRLPTALYKYVTKSKYCLPHVKACLGLEEVGCLAGQGQCDYSHEPVPAEELAPYKLVWKA